MTLYDNFFQEPVVEGVEEGEDQVDDPQVDIDGQPAAKVPKKNPYKELPSYLEEQRKHNETANNSADPSTSVYEMIQTDMDSYEKKGKRTPALEQLYSALLTVPPTSAEVIVALHCRTCP